MDVKKLKAFEIDFLSVRRLVVTSESENEEMFHWRKIEPNLDQKKGSTYLKSNLCYVLK